MDSINLLPQVAETEIKQGVYKRKFNVAAIASLLVIGGVVVLLFGYQLYLSARDKTLTTETDQTQTQIAAKREIEIKQRALVEKLQAISDYFSKNKATSKPFKEIVDLASSGQVGLNRVQIDSKGQVSLSGSAANSTNLGKFFDNLTDEGAQVTLDKVVANSISLASGNYQFTVRLNYTVNGLVDQEKAK